MFKYFGIALVVLALGIGIIPHYTDCLSQGATVTLANGKTQPMKCHWSANAEIGVAIPLGVAGVLMTTSRRKQNFRNLSVLGIAFGVIAMLLPAQIIGTCATPTHICNTAMKPALMSLGGLVAGLGALGFVMSMRQKDSDL